MLPWTMMSAGCDVPSPITIASSAMCDEIRPESQVRWWREKDSNPGPRDRLAEDRDDGSPFRGRWRRKVSAEE
jgi:hypothetical protein